MRNIFKTLSVLLSYPGETHRVLYKYKQDLGEIIGDEDPQIARLIMEFMDKTDPYSIDEKYVSLFEMPPKCPLYAHEHLPNQKESEVGNFLLEIKIFYKAKGLDIDASKEIPDYLPAMLEYMANLLPEDKGLARSFARKYFKPWIGRWVDCVKKEGGEYALLAEAVMMAIDRVLGEES